MHTIIRIPLWFVQLILAFLLFLNIHELLHTITARVLGDPTAYYVLYERYQDGYAIGRNYASDDYLTPLAAIIVSLAAPVGTRLLSELLPIIRAHRWNRPGVFWAVLFVTLRLDFIGYVVRNFIGDVFFQQSYSSQDISKPIHIVSAGDDHLRLVLWALFIVIAFADVLLDRRRIRRYFQREHLPVSELQPQPV
jgi:hypothetical protein